MFALCSLLLSSVLSILSFSPLYRCGAIAKHHASCLETRCALGCREEKILH
jgi:hypothetical protein